MVVKCKEYKLRERSASLYVLRMNHVYTFLQAHCRPPSHTDSAVLSSITLLVALCFIIQFVSSVFSPSLYCSNFLCWVYENKKKTKMFLDACLRLEPVQRDTHTTHTYIQNTNCGVTL